jgi:hypothetical protein
VGHRPAADSICVYAVVCRIQRRRCIKPTAIAAAEVAAVPLHDATADNGTDSIGANEEAATLKCRTLCMPRCRIRQPTELQDECSTSTAVSHARSVAATSALSWCQADRQVEKSEVAARGGSIHVVHCLVNCSCANCCSTCNVRCLRFACSAAALLLSSVACCPAELRLCAELQHHIVNTQRSHSCQCYWGVTHGLVAAGELLLLTAFHLFTTQPKQHLSDALAYSSAW